MEAPTQNPILQVRSIAKSFGDRQVLRSVDFELIAGKNYGLVGTNGSGKTTLFNILGGFLDADNGEIHFKGSNLSSKSSFKISRLGMGRTFQDLRLAKELTVLENVLLSFPTQEGEKWWKAMLPARVYRTEQEGFKSKALKTLDQTFLGDVANQKAGEISYGQQKLLTLACCLAQDADLLLLDEPVAGINPAYQDKMVTLLSDIRKSGKTILLIEHNAEFLSKACDRVLFLNDGLITPFDSYENLRNNQSVQEAYV